MNRIKILYKQITNKIAFYPSLISFGGFLSALLMIYLEELHISKYLLDTAPILVINDTETARIILSTFIGGLISLMVFSFSMVMVLLNQASSNFSPRVLPGLISNKKHQIVLGLYIGTILYNTFILISIEPTKNSYQTPGFSVLLGIVLTVCCLAAFIYFIHSISQTIQVNNILRDIYSQAKKRIKKQISKESDTPINFPKSENWYTYKIEQSGYFHTILEDDLLELCHENDLKITLVPYQGQFLLNGTLGFKSEKALDDSLKNEILSMLSFSSDEPGGVNYIYAFRQITEIAIKAMSPGINDPGTALNALDYLTELFAVLTTKEDRNRFLSKNKIHRVEINTVSFEDLLYNVMAIFRQYCKHDVIVVQKLFGMLNAISEITRNKKHKKILYKELKALKNDAMANIKNDRDVEKLEGLFKLIA